jgi:hypothetical protein
VVRWPIYENREQFEPDVCCGDILGEILAVTERENFEYHNAYVGCIFITQKKKERPLKE